MNDSDLSFKNYFVENGAKMTSRCPNDYVSILWYYIQIYFYKTINKEWFLSRLSSVFSTKEGLVDKVSFADNDFSFWLMWW